MRGLFADHNLADVSATKCGSLDYIVWSGHVFILTPSGWVV